ncbi:MAG: phage baseplate assembly protein V [Acidobacteriota bacterium]
MATPTLIGTLQALVQAELRRLRIAELGLVEATYPHAADGDSDNYACDVRLKASGLLLHRVPVATGHVGTAAIPNVGDLVLLNFDRGDVQQPIVVGRLYNDEDRPPINARDEVIFRLPLAESDERTVQASIRNRQDSGDGPPRRLKVELAPKVTLEIHDEGVTATAGAGELKLDQPGASGGVVTLEAGGTRLTLDQDGDLTIEAAGALTLEARRGLTLKGQSVSIEGRTTFRAEAGTSATLQGSASAAVKGGASTTVEGGSVRLRGVTEFSP